MFEGKRIDIFCGISFVNRCALHRFEVSRMMVLYIYIYVHFIYRMSFIFYNQKEKIIHVPFCSKSNEMHVYIIKLQ